MYEKIYENNTLIYIPKKSSSSSSTRKSTATSVPSLHGIISSK